MAKRERKPGANLMDGNTPRATSSPSQAQPARSSADTSDKAGDLRSRLGKLCGMLGSAHAGERSNACDAIDQLLARAGLTWAWLGDITARGVLPDGDREKLLARLVAERLDGGLGYAWAMTGEEAKFVREVIGRCETDLSGTSAIGIARALATADEARRRADSPARRNLK